MSSPDGDRSPAARRRRHPPPSDLDLDGDRRRRRSAPTSSMVWTPGSTSAGIVTVSTTPPSASAVAEPNEIGVECSVIVHGLPGQEAHRR